MLPRLSIAALVLLALALFAFWPAYISRLSVADGYTHAHAALGTCWLILLAVQPVLARRSLRSGHRLLGRFGVFLGAAFFLSSLLIAHRSVARLSLEQFMREGRFVYLPLAMALIFALSLSLAVLWRHNAAAHGRFMAATALPLLDPLFARLLYFYAPPLPAQALYQAPAFSLSLAVILAMLVSLPPNSPARRAFQYFSSFVAAILVGIFVFPDTSTWESFVMWFRSLPLT